MSASALAGLRWFLDHWPVALALLFMLAVLYLFTALFLDLPLPGAARSAEQPTPPPRRPRD
jgi:hypothetical protein